jgi:hypothetical protein
VVCDYNLIGLVDGNTTQFYRCNQSMQRAGGKHKRHAAGYLGRVVIELAGGTVVSGARRSQFSGHSKNPFSADDLAGTLKENMKPRRAEQTAQHARCLDAIETHRVRELTGCSRCQTRPRSTARRPSNRAQSIADAAAFRSERAESCTGQSGRGHQPQALDIGAYPARDADDWANIG